MAEEKSLDTIVDYIAWRGDLSFEQDPFNDVDNCILSQLVYLDLKTVLNPMLKSGPTLRELYQVIEHQNCFRFLTAMGGGEDFVKAAAESKRFGTIRITQFKDVFEKERVQFAAMHFELNEHTSYIAYRGTDTSIIGWREDFISSFKKTEGQQLASDYLKKTMDRNHDYYIGGHSKGGNHAVYAASELGSIMRHHVLRIYDNDGPGFAKDIYDMDKIGSLDPILTKIIPEYDIIGQLFSRPISDVKIVKSSASGLMQHDGGSWAVKGNQLVCAEMIDPEAVMLNETISTWIQSADLPSREIFVKELFDSFEANGVSFLDELSLKNIPDIIYSMISASRQTKGLMKNLQNTYFANAKKYAGQMLENFAEERFGKTQGRGKKKKEEVEGRQD